MDNANSLGNYKGVKTDYFCESLEKENIINLRCFFIIISELRSFSISKFRQDFIGLSVWSLNEQQKIVFCIMNSY